MARLPVNLQSSELRISRPVICRQLTIDPRIGHVNILGGDRSIRKVRACKHTPSEIVQVTILVGNRAMRASPELHMSLP